MQRPLRDPAISFEQIVQLSPDGVLVVDGDGRIAFVNDRLTEMTGYGDHELVGRPVTILLPDGLPSDNEESRPAHGERPAVPGGTELDVVCLRKDGTRIASDVAVTTATTAGDAFTIVTVRDAPRSRSGGQALFEAERQWNDLLNGVRLVVVGLDHDGRIEIASPFFLSLTGYEEHEVVGAEWFPMFISPHGRTEVQEVFEEVLDASGSGYHVNPILTKRGDQRLIAWFNTVRHGPDGSVLGTLSVGEDITDRVRAEARLRAISEVTQGVLTDQPLDDLLHLLAGQARQLVGADGATIVLPQDDDTLAVAAAEGAEAQRIEGTLLLHGQSISGDVMTSRKGEMIEDASSDPRVSHAILALGEIGPALFVPLTAGGRTLGLLVVANRPGGRHFDSHDLQIVESVASHASIALQYKQAQQELQRLLVMEDRERIARDLHDHVIQRLFATGLSLTSLRQQAREPAVSERITDAVEQIDLTMSDLRSTIFDLRRQEGTNGLREQVLDVIDDAAGPLGFRPHVRFAGVIDGSIGDDVIHHVVGVIREALSNVARHARARHVLVLVEVGDDLVLRVIDDGIGIPPELTRSSGLGNLHGRATTLGGTLSVGAGEGGGTRLEWRVPLGDPHPHG